MVEVPRLNRQWCAAALRLGAVFAVHRLIDLTVSGTLNGKSCDEWRWQRELGDLISEFSEARAWPCRYLIAGKAAL